MIVHPVNYLVLHQ